MARLGDFNGDNVDDFAIGASGYNAAVGRVVIVLGKVGFGSVALPDTTNSITIDGNSALTTQLFGARVLGMGRVFTGATGTSLVVSAPGLSGTSSSAGNVYVFQGQAGTMGAIALASANTVITGPAANSDIGQVLVNVGPIRTAVPTLGIGNPADMGGAGSVYLLSGDATAGYFSTKTTIVRAGIPRQGQVVIGGGISGRNAVYSLLGGPLPDVVVTGQSSAFQIIDGDTLSTIGTTTVDSGNLATAQITPPSGWSTGQNQGTLIPDINGDTYPDFAIGSAIGAVVGSTVVYW